MTEIDRIVSLCEKLYNGEPWIDVSILSVLESITSSQAAKRNLKNCNSIWEIVNHLIEWRLNVLQRLQGFVIQTPANNYFEVIEIMTDKAWTDTLKKFEDTQARWLDFLKKFKPNLFETEYPTNKMSYYEHIQGILQHDAYHLGQIVLLAKNL